MTELKVCVIAHCEMGHFIPCLHIAEELASRGHEVHYITLSYNRERCERMITEAGCIPHITDDHFTREEFDRAFKTKGGLLKLLDEIFPFLEEQVKLIQPDVAVADFFYSHVPYMMDSLGIPCVVNEPGMIAPEAIVDKYYEPGSFKVCFGLGAWRQSIISWVAYKFFSWMAGDTKRMMMLRSHHATKIKLVNSFWGLEKPIPLPPTYVMTGPLVKKQTGLIQALQVKDPKLYEWLEKAQKEGKPVVYLSLGSVCCWELWEVEALYHGLKELGARVVWSIKNPEYIPDQEDPDLYVSPWVPQVEMLAHPAIKAGLTHCGFGGVLEFTSAGVPIAAFPHFADQGPNAMQVVKTKMGISLIPFRKSFRGASINSSFKTPLFDKEKVKKVFSELLENPVYLETMQKLSLQASLQGGRQLAARTIEGVAMHGDAHLVLDKSEKNMKMSCWGCCCLRLLVVLWMAAVVFSAVILLFF